ncbi:uncharacterized protein LOC119775105 [Cyprinodon tularosa]|uniref:uncharacterized protein LOC119775105 n=1 Tax=Cyprinodon tularosa TaxID=77115 RepID=UPI0018E2089E|nr:uncharacterized protein LOC119775105 [Cyprinodon tularosa]
MEKSKQNAKLPYREKLNNEARDRYLALDINGIDPYDLRSKDWSSDVSSLPPTSSVDITTYLVFGVSAYTCEEFKAYKSLEAHGQFTNGWVQDLFSYRPQMCNNTVVTAKVMHSQRLNDTPLKPWAIIDRSGAISSAHCTCMAGIAETCTHVAAMLFKLEATIRCREKTTVTGEPAYWMIPNNINKVGAEVGHKIDFTSSKAKRKSLDQLLDGQAEHMPALRTVTSTCTGNTSTQDQWSAYLCELQKASPKAAVLSCVPGFCDSFADTLQPCPAPDSLSRLRDKKMDCSDLSALRLHCKTLLKKADISQDQAHYIELHSRSQHRSSTWYRFRTGRVTASTMHAVFRSDLDNPAVSTVKAVCGTNSGATNHCAATVWGRQNEQRGQTQYKQKMENQHCDFELSQSGFIINPKFPQVGASPDAIVLCTCCGKGCVEIKCPFKYRDNTILEACRSGDKNFCLEMVDGKAAA